MIPQVENFDVGTMAWLKALPKAELHLHLEGAIPLSALWLLVEKYGNPDNLIGVGDLAQRFQYRDFLHFIDTWMWKNRYLREYEDFTLIAQAVAHDLASQNIRYAEVFFSPSDFASAGLTPQGLASAIRKGLDQVGNVEIALIADVVRNIGPEASSRVLGAVSEVKDHGIIGIGIGGPEDGFPPEPYQMVYEQARQLGFHTTAHAGEAAGADSVWGAIRALNVERIGHATRAPEDPALIPYLVESQIPLEMCPWSNVCTAVIPDITHHPIKRMMDAGCMVTVNTDDPKMFGNSLAEEYALLMMNFDFSRDDIRQFILNGLRGSWLSEERKAAYLSQFASDAVWTE